MRMLVSGAALLLALGLSGCSDDAARPRDDAGSGTASAVPSYDGGLAPSAAVLPLVPQGAATLTVTDLDRARAELGMDELRTSSDPAAQAAFWTQAAQSEPLLSDGLLRPVDPQLRSAYGISETDVSWEARFADADGNQLGYVLHLRDGTDPAAFQRAVTAGVGPLAGASVDAADMLVTSGAAAQPSQSWAADADTRALVGLPALGYFVQRGCVTRRDDPSGLDPLTQYSVQLETVLATARLGEGRTDLFDRLHLATASPSFTGVFEGGVADPMTGRLGFRMTNPPAAAALTAGERLAFAACGSA